MLDRPSFFLKKKMLKGSDQTVVAGWPADVYPVVHLKRRGIIDPLLRLLSLASSFRVQTTNIDRVT